MNVVRIKKSKLATILEENLKDHIKEYTEAVAGYKVAALRQIDAEVAKLKEAVHDLKHGEVIKVADIRFRLPVPINRSDEYERLAYMLELTEDDVIELSEHDFKCYVQDQWDWAVNAKAINMSYTEPGV